MNNAAMQQAVQKAAKPKFYGQQVKKSKVVTHYPEHLVREYTRIANAYMTLLNKALAGRLPEIRQAIDAERAGARMDDAGGVRQTISQTFMRVFDEFQKKAEGFGLERKLANLSKLARKLTVREWKRVVHNTLGIDVMGDYYMGEFFRGAMKLWAESNVNLIKTIPKDTLANMMDIVREGYEAGKSNAAIGREIQEEYGIGRRRAQFIARDQMAKLNADLTRAQQQDAGVELYVWSSSRDQRVRDRHAQLDGKRFKWGDPPIVDERTGRRAEPGQDYNCRCVALPVFNLPGLDLPWEKPP